MPFYPEKFISDTSHVPWDAAGAYALLLMHAWARGGSLPDDENQLRLMVRCHSKAWNRVWQQIAPFWTVGGDGRLHQKRMDLEWKRVREVRARRAAEAREKGKGKDDQKPLNDSERKIPDGKKSNDIYARARTCPPLNILTENSLSKVGPLQRSAMTNHTRPTSPLRGYDWPWRRLRKRHLAQYPWCVRCGARGVDVDHVVPVRIAPDRRLDPTNLRTLLPSMS
jgi:uncharacterized protein YdaU (DUF1376 family)